MKRITREWVRKAENALRAARQLLKLRPLVSDEVAFHCQQTIEKYVKGLLFQRGLPVQKTHDLTALLDKLIPTDGTLRSLRPGLKGISRFAGEYRYPGINTTAGQARAAYKKAFLVREEIRKRLGLRRLK